MSTLNRRRFTQAAAALPLAWVTASAPALASSGRVVLVAAWQAQDAWRVGWLAVQAGRSVAAVVVLAAMDVPTRAHHVGIDRAGRLLAVARRPGDWLLRWAGAGSAPQWQWAEPSRSLNGHSLPSPDGRRVLTTETDLDSGAGLVGVRDAGSLAKLDEWPTGGVDPHQLLWHPQEAQQLFVANGGIATRPETGRSKHGLAGMDSSLVRIDARSGASSGQWRLNDPRLSLRHLAWQGSMLGIAMQAEHDTPEQRAHAPVLATFDGRALRAAPPAEADALVGLGGYGGDIAATGDGFIVSCPRAGGVVHFDLHGERRAFAPLPQACALARIAQGQLFAAGDPRGAQLAGVAARAESGFDFGPLRLDNHWSWASLPAQRASGLRRQIGRPK